MTRNRFDRSFDAATELKDAGLIAADAAAQVGGADQILDLAADDGVDGPPSGSDGSRIDGTVIVDVSAVEIASNDENYKIIAQVSNSPTFASGIKNVGILELADTVVASGGADDGEVGHYEFGISNEVNGVAFRYLRLFTDVSGTIATGIDYTAHFAKAA
jgi:hypothetical protein